jgi:hypothetical protein
MEGPSPCLGIFAMVLALGCEDGSAPTMACARGGTPGVDCDVSLPPPNHGYQLVVGSLPVAPGTEVLRCFWRKVPFDMDVTEIQIAYNRGSHHLDVYTVGYGMRDGDFDCSNPNLWGQWPSEVARGLDPDSPLPRMLVGFQNERVTWQLPAGVGYRIKGGQQLLVQSHYANATTQKTPSRRMLDVINFVAAGSPVQSAAETLFDEDTELHLPPLASYQRVRYCKFPRPVNLIGMFGHFHSRGRSFAVFPFDPDTQQVDARIYFNTQWDDPPWLTTDNWRGSPVVRGIQMVADYVNNEDRVINWGPYVDLNEHMETYAIFYPRLDIDAGCICFHDGEPPEHIAHGHPELCPQAVTGP